MAAKLAKQRRQLSPAFAADDGEYTNPVRGRFLRREEKAACIFLYVGGVRVSEEIFRKIADEPLKVFVLS